MRPVARTISCQSAGFSVVDAPLDRIAEARISCHTTQLRRPPTADFFSAFNSKIHYMKPYLLGRARTAIVLLSFVLTPLSLQATQLAYEGFDYPSGAVLTGHSGGFGWGGLWQTVNNGSADVLD